MDERFLGLVRNNDVVGVSVVLLEGIVCSDACPNLGTLRDEFGRSVLELAVDRGSHEVAEVLLDHSVPMGDALLYAVDREDIRAVKMLFKTALRNDIDRSDDVDTKLGSSAFPSYMTPVMLAAQKNNYPILKILLDAGFPKPEPDDYHWTASIGNGRAWLDAYRAVCSPSYILLTSTDPFRTAFRTAKVLRDVCWKRENYRPQLEELADQCETFAVELLGEVRTTKEIETILGHLCNPEDSPSGKAVCTLQMAVDLEMKQFVTHPLSVDHVDIMTYRELIGFHRYFTGWEKWSSAHALCVTTAIGLAYPLLCLAHLIAPKSKLHVFSSQSTVADDWARKANENSFQPVAVADVLFSIFTIVVFMRAIQEWPAIAETAGKIIYALHHVVEVLVLANLLIAIISNSYTRAEEVKRTDWGFEVVKNSLHYLQVDVTLPPPFTLIMSTLLSTRLSHHCQRNKIAATKRL
ncbi:short transient receptor potential channel 5-like [Branchiostoma floridae]|uniref:Short transient receptor potential channel 5-like n=1 Tax=Branchiostoma floridae TaxID=7739 RepID=A0A9J7MJP8_BRAFL|nr:short transient receptor potential channel 5-like [Branchiostoma floridae]